MIEKLPVVHSGFGISITALALDDPGRRAFNGEAIMLHVALAHDQQMILTLNEAGALVLGLRSALVAAREREKAMQKQGREDAKMHQMTLDHP